MQQRYTLTYTRRPTLGDPRDPIKVQCHAEYAPGQELWRVEIAVNDELRDSAFFPEPWEAMREFFDSYMNEKLSEPVSS